MPIAPVILSVDDADANQYLVSRILRQAGYTVREAGSGHEALRQVREMNPKPDLVLLDVHLPDVDGFEVCRQIKADPHTAPIPVLQISAHYTATPERIRGLAGGADGYLVSPVDPEELVANIGALIRIRELVQKEQRLRTVLETVCIGIWDWNLRTNECNWSPNAALLLGLDPCEFGGSYEAFRRRIHPDDLTLFESRVQEARLGQTVYQCEYRVCWPDGTEHWLEGKGFFTYDDEGLPLWMTGVLTDVGERRAAALALRVSDERFRTALAMVAHELRNPLAAIQNALYVLRHGEQEEGGNERALSIAERQVALQAKLVDDLMDMARLGRGKLTIQPKRVSLNRLVSEMTAEFASRAEAAGISLQAVTTGGELFVDADPARLIQVVGNLISNAIKFTPAGGDITVTLAKGVEQTALLTICDTGVGMEPEFVQHAFDRFAQLDSGSLRAQGGLGLGLALARGLVQLHGGEITLESPGLGRGCTARVCLPLAASEPAGAASPVLREAGGPVRRVLIIDDNQDAADSLGELLELKGHEVRVAYTGTEGVELARGYVPEVVVSDLDLPGMSGFNVAETLRKDTQLQGAHLIALSGYGRDEDVARCQAAGFDRHFLKPVNVEQLLAYLAALLPR